MGYALCTNFYTLFGAHFYILFEHLSVHFYIILYIVGAHFYALLVHNFIHCFIHCWYRIPSIVGVVFMHSNLGSHDVASCPVLCFGFWFIYMQFWAHGSCIIYLGCLCLCYCFYALLVAITPYRWNKILCIIGTHFYILSEHIFIHYCWL
jgi:hypothetical protein